MLMKVKKRNVQHWSLLEFNPPGEYINIFVVRDRTDGMYEKSMFLERTRKFNKVLFRRRSLIDVLELSCTACCSQKAARTVLYVRWATCMNIFQRCRHQSQESRFQLAEPERCRLEKSEEAGHIAIGDPPAPEIWYVSSPDGILVTQFTFLYIPTICCLTCTSNHPLLVTAVDLCFYRSGTEPCYILKEWIVEFCSMKLFRCNERAVKAETSLLWIMQRFHTTATTILKLARSKLIFQLFTWSKRFSCAWCELDFPENFIVSLIQARKLILCLSHQRCIDLSCLLYLTCCG